MRTIHRNIVSTYLVSKDGRYFFGYKDPKAGTTYADCWKIPGGGIEEGETQIEALQREVLEEVGLDITPYEPELLDDTMSGSSEKILRDGEHVNVEMDFISYRTQITDKNADEIELALSDEFDECVWLKPEEFSTIKLSPPSITILTKLGLLS